jgi:ADP-ribose pyrophosphatase YjhB (NUDIX family)
LVVQDEKVLLVRRAMVPKQGAWSLPAGFVDDGEDPKESAVRECREETGLEVRIDELLDVIYGKEHERGASIVILYAAERIGGRLEAGDDADEVGFFSPDDLPELAFEATRKGIGLLFPSSPEVG